MAQILVGGVDSTGPHVFSLDPLAASWKRNVLLQDQVPQ